jgi:UDP-N-acetylmuramoyl-L-alanyl-D-glutamate--2,6-diaminopimelate ligase
MFNIKANSSKVNPGDIFVAIKGHTVDGHKFIDDAVKRGAKIVVVSEDIPEIEGVKIIKTEDTQKWLNAYLLDTYANTFKKMKFVGVTGTNGKTTTCFLTYETLLAMGVNACYIGTIGYYDKDTHYELPNTTPSMIDLYEILDKAYEKGIETVVMEVSSHSLVEKRVAGLQYETVGYTNITQDHLDFHKTMDNYLNAKLLLLDQVKDKSKVIYNQDDPYLGKETKLQDGISYGFSGKDLKMFEYQDTDFGTHLVFKYKDKFHYVDTRLKNRFNVYNYIMSAILTSNLGYDLDEVLSHSMEIDPPAGRCDVVPYNQGKIIVDYAHTPDAVEKIITSFQENNNGRIITIIGCGGDRDKTKRPIMGNIATTNSDYAIITSDNPRTEDPNKIIEDILGGINRDNYIVVPDRIEAIHKGIDMLRPEDTLLILGKGHENYQIIGTVKHHMDDKEIARDYIEEKRKANQPIELKKKIGTN